MTDLERLVNEWIEHGSIVLAVDFDDTIFHWRHRTTEECKKTLELVKWCQTVGAYVMIHTCSDENRYDEIKRYCQANGLVIDSINENPIKLPFGNQGKPYYNWQLCDRSGLQYAEYVLDTAAKIVLTHKQQKITKTEIA